MKREFGKVTKILRILCPWLWFLCNTNFLLKGISERGCKLRVCCDLVFKKTKLRVAIWNTRDATCLFKKINLGVAIYKLEFNKQNARVAN